MKDNGGGHRIRFIHKIYTEPVLPNKRRGARQGNLAGTSFLITCDPVQ